MAIDLDFLSLKFIQTPNDTASWMWNPNHPSKEDDDSWEVRAFAEDTANILGTTWPPRSYTCNFCRREFRSAQALGGHMNVHRRDRARLHHPPLPPGSSTTSSAVSVGGSSNNILIPTQDFITSSGGFCFLYSLQNPSSIINGSSESPSTFFSISPYQMNNLASTLPTQSIDFPLAPQSMNSSLSYSTHTEPSPSGSKDNNHNNNGNVDSTMEELDLELRLGRGSSPS